jgi:hypothetical protein
MSASVSAKLCIACLLDIICMVMCSVLRFKRDVGWLLVAR